MPLTPGIGTLGGQQYPVLRSIQTFLQQMAEGGARTSATVIKELLQNADDAEASEVAVILDERPEPRHLPPNYADLIGPALLVRNNARFRVPEECAPNEPDDFTAIRDVARGHKRAQATAAGRFGIGFNSVYFLTDTPLLFSRREVHIFDLLHRVLEVDGWRFSLDDFPANASSHAGPVKNVIDWCLPRAAIGGNSFGSLAMAPRGDFHQTIFRLPLRRTPSGTSAIYEDRFPREADRLRVLREMAGEGARSILFLKHVTAISFSILREYEPEAVALIEATPPPSDFAAFLEQVRELASRVALGPRCECQFGRTIRSRWFGPSDGPTETTWNFHVEHVGRFDDEALLRLREHLGRNDERAIPWVSVAIPLDVSSCRFDGRGPAAWRVFLPLLERGPSATVFSACLFIGPSRQRVEFRLNESDEGRRRTEWNKALAERALVPLLHNLSLDLPDIASELLDANPREYLALFPSSVDGNDEEAAGGFTGFVRQRFGEGVWHLRLPDIWGDPFEMLVGDEKTSLEMIPEWLLGYRDRFRDLRAPQRRFVRDALGDALAARVGGQTSVVVRRQPSLDVAFAVLRHQDPPGLRDLVPLLQLVAKSGASREAWDGVWAFAESGSGHLLRYDQGPLYVRDDPEAQHEALDALRRLRLRFGGATWILPDAGLATMAPDLRPRPENIVEPSARVALELLRRLPEDNAHDQVQQVHLIRPIVDFLIKESGIPADARLGFLVRTAHQKLERRALGVILLRPPMPTASDDALWEAWFRGVFAEVDPGFASEINRLLSAHPGAGAMLHAQDCSVAIGEMKAALAILHALRLRAPEVYERLQGEMNGESSQRAESALRISAGLIESADAEWDRLGPEERYTVRALPIHRRPDGRFTSLVPARGDDPSGRSEVAAFRLQSNEDVEDAPIALPACQLLQTANAGTRRFYRRRLGLEEHGRVAVLKDVLRQIGDADPSANERMLRYLASTYADTVRRLEATGDDVDRVDAQELQRLFGSARTVPCLDGRWRAPSECLAVWRVADRLTQQGWPAGQLAGQLGQLFHGEPVAAIGQSARRLVQQLHELREHDPGTIVERALSSDSAEFSFRDRAKVLADNWRDDRAPRTARSAAAGYLELPVLAGQGQLAEAEMLDEHAADLPVSVRRVLSPHAVDVRCLAGEVGLQAARVRAVLAAFGVPTCSAEDLDARLVERFAEIWPSLGQEERLRVLRHIGEHGLASRFRAQAVRLDTVLVSSRGPVWRQPMGILSPKLAQSDPPCLSPGSVAEAAGVEQSVRDVWGEWCGVQTLTEVLALALEGAARSTGDLRIPATAVCRWLERVVTLPLRGRARIGSHLSRGRDGVVPRGEDVVG